MKDCVHWPNRTWLAVLLLAGHLVFPGIVWVICLQTESPTGNAIDWAAQSPTARTVDALFNAHILYALILTVAMRGWRRQAVAIGFVGLLVSAVTNFFAYFTVTGVYW
jgi:hypothetical protein